tara:strand:- start:6829 stop:7302 length:474 start_codon:yes stop_codon:yes gene_type:complete
MQIFVLNKILFFDYILISPYLLVLILYPYYKDSILNLFIWFTLGILLDIFNDSLGLYALISIIIIYFKNLWVLKIIGNDKANEITLLSIFNLGKLNFFNYSFPVIILYYLLIIIFEFNDFFSFYNFLTLTLSSVSTYFFMVLIQYLFLKSDQENEWR